MASPAYPPILLYSDGQGNIYEDPDYQTVGRSGWDIQVIDLEDWIELPAGGSLYELPDRKGYGISVATGELEICEKGWAVAAFIPPAYTGFYISAYDSIPEAQTLPLFCYTAVGWCDGKFYVPARRIEKDIRQDIDTFDDSTIRTGVQKNLELYPKNRLVKHLAENCALTYHCPAARNYFMHRWECPIPSSPACNANCVGCISLQADEEEITSSHDRITFKPTVEEIVEYTVPHLMTAENPIISFGQGCEGEPLLMHETIASSIKEIRKHTEKGTININTNAGQPQAVEKLMNAGLDSMRVSMNSMQEKYYMPYYRPNNYTFQDLITSMKIVKQYGGWVSINYFVFPGLTDSANEFQALKQIIRETNIDLIQWRNFSIDPDWYLKKINWYEDEASLGMSFILEELHKEFPNLKYGYFNPSKERMADFDNFQMKLSS